MTTENSQITDEISVSDLVRKYFSAYELKDRRTIEDLLSDDFTFTSPLDDRMRHHVTRQRTIGTPQATARLVYTTPDQPSLLQSLSVSSEAAFVAGASLKIDGGFTA